MTLLKLLTSSAVLLNINQALTFLFFADGDPSPFNFLKLAISRSIFPLFWESPRAFDSGYLDLIVFL